eukprot:8291963-Ditylum_brightwellii.AAC.1
MAYAGYDVGRCVASVLGNSVVYHGIIGGVQKTAYRRRDYEVLYPVTEHLRLERIHPRAVELSAL